MPDRFYLCPVIGSGASVADAFRPACAPALAGLVWSMVDARPNPTLGAGNLFVRAAVTDAQHAAILATVGVVGLPFEDAGGGVIPLTGTLAQVSAANRSLLQTRLEAAHVPVSDFIATDRIVGVVLRMVRRFLLRQVLAADDWTEGLDTLVSAVAAAKRQRINAALTSLGIDTSGIQGSDTIRTALRIVTSQLVDTTRAAGDLG